MKKIELNRGKGKTTCCLKQALKLVKKGKNVIYITPYGMYHAYELSLRFGNMIDGKIDEALKLFRLPRTVGELDGQAIVATKGRFGPYIKYGDKMISLPKGADPLKVTLEECVKMIEEDRNTLPVNATILEFKDSGISILNGRFGPYIKKDGVNFRIPRGTDVSKLTEEDCLNIVNNSKPGGKTYKRKR